MKYYRCSFLMQTSDSSCGSNGSPRTITPHVGTSSQGYSSKQLQRRLEQRIETARRLHNSRNNKPQSSPNGNSLIPIQRLPIPGCKEQQPLVEWDTEDRYVKYDVKQHVFFWEQLNIFVVEQCFSPIYSSGPL